MIVSEARREANRRNARLSSGPKSEAGKQRSRANALKHGLTGDGLTLPAEVLAEVDRRAEAFEDDLRPANEAARCLVRRAAMLSVRLERCVEHESMALARRCLTAEKDQADDRFEAAEELIGRLEAEPSLTLCRLRRTPEGCDRLIACWADLRSDLDRPGRWTPAHLARAEALTGRRAGEFGISAFARLSESLADDSAAALAGLRGRIDAEVTGLIAARDGIDREALAIGAAERALFDPSAEAVLARRYEAAAERGFFRCLKEVERINREAEPQEPTPPPPAPGRAEVASFCPTAPIPPEEPPAPPEPRPEPVAGPVATSPSPRHERREHQAEARREARRRKLERRRS